MSVPAGKRGESDIEYYSTAYRIFYQIVNYVFYDFSAAKNNTLNNEENIMFRHHCDYVITKRSNTIQYDDMGYPLRLCIRKCYKCGKSTQDWIDTEEQKDDVVLKWKKYCVKD